MREALAEEFLFDQATFVVDVVAVREMSYKNKKGIRTGVPRHPVYAFDM